MGNDDLPRASAVIVPEKGLFAREVQTGLTSRFWGGQCSSSSSLDAIFNLGPCELAPVPLLAPSGVSRSQLLVAAQAVRLPCMPGYSAGLGGLVTDRVILHTGGDHWWANMTARLKAQKVLQQRQWSALKDAGNFQLCANLKASLSSADVIKAKIEVEPHPQGAAMACKRPSPGLLDEAAGEPAQVDLQESPLTVSETPSAPSAQERPCRLRSATVACTAQYRRVLGGSELCARLGVNERQLPSSTVESTTPTERTPLSLSVDLTGPRSAGGSWLQYRLGILQATLPEDVGESGRSYKSLLHCQAGVAVQGHKAIWQGVPTHRLHRSSARGKNGTEKDKGEASGGAPSSSPLSPSVLFPSRVAAPKRHRAPASHRRKSAQRRDGRDSDPDAAAGGRGEGLLANLLRLVKPATSDKVGDETDPASGKKGGGMRAWAQSLKRVSPTDSEVLIVPEEVQESIQDTTQSLQRVQEDVKGLTEWVSSGGMLALLNRVADKVTGGSEGGGASRPHRQPRGPWSAFVPAPHLKVGGLFGIAAGAPLMQHSNRQDTPGGRTASQGSTGTAAGGSTEGAAGGQLVAVPQPMQAGGDVAEVAGGASSGHIGWRPALTWAKTNWQQAVGQARLQPFATLVASAQVGRFQRPVLDFSRLVARLDLGLPGSHQGTTLESPGRPPLSFYSPGTWHALTLSACQQVIGPIRVCADLRFALESDAAATADPFAAAVAAAASRDGQAGEAADGKTSWGKRWSTAQRAGGEGIAALAGHVRSMRPTLMEAVYALDMVVPGSSGAARLVAWYAPTRKEGMLQLRLF